MARSRHDETCGYVSRGGLKLRHALDAFAPEPWSLDARGLVCADFGCSTGGFTDCLLKAGAARVYALDTAYGELAWALRQDPRVVVLERTNCLHAAVPPEVGGGTGVDLIVADAGWTPQSRLAGAFLRWMGRGGRCVTLIKPHYEAHARDPKGTPKGGVLEAAVARRTCARACEDLEAAGLRVLGVCESPITGGKHAASGNVEYLALVERA